MYGGCMEHKLEQVYVDRSGIMKLEYLFKNLYKKLKGYTDDTAKDLVIIRNFTSGNVTVSANSAIQVSVPYTVPSGYKVVEPVFARTNGNVAAIYASGITSDQKVTAWVRNWGTSAMTITVTIFVLFIKNVGG